MKNLLDTIEILTQEYVKNRKSDTKAIAILDNICNQYKNHKMELKLMPVIDKPYAFITDPHPESLFGLLLVEAFAPNRMDDLFHYAPMLDNQNPHENEAYELWQKEVYEPFVNRYNFC